MKKPKKHVHQYILTEKQWEDFNKLLNESPRNIPQLKKLFQPKSSCLDVEKLKESKIQLEAWQEVFGTTQLTHAKARLDEAEKNAKFSQKGLDVGKFAKELESLDHTDILDLADYILNRERKLILKANEKLQDIVDICVNYDGYKTVEGLKGLIDDIKDYASKSQN